MTATPVMNPTIAEKRITTSVPIATEGVNSVHVWQLATQMPNSFGRKKSSRQGRRAGEVEFRGALSRPAPEETAKGDLSNYEV